MAVNVQDHIHIDTVIGAAPENAPTMTWTIRKREESISFRAEISDTLTGNIYAHVIKSTGVPVVRHNFNYEIKLMGEGSNNVFYYKNLLDSMAGKYVYLVDSYHPDDGEDHTTYVKQYFMFEIGPYPTDHYSLTFFYVPITLISMEQP